MQYLVITLKSNFFSWVFISTFFVFLILRFLAGEGARAWAKSKGVNFPETIEGANEVTSLGLHFTIQ